MRSLFTRIFLSFWVAMLLVLAATAAVAWYRFNQVQSVNVDINALGNEASARLLVGGLPALHEWIDEAEERYRDRRIFIVDESGNDIRKRELPTNYRNYVQRLRDAGFLGKELIPSRRDDPLLLTPLFTDRNGRVYTVMVSRPTWQNLLFAPNVSIALLVSGLVLSVLVSWSLARYLSKPVERLQSSARSLAAGNMEARVGAEFSQRRDELGVLARDFDKMADHVRNLIASKENLLRAMSHELRSPLARLRVATGLARRPGADVARQLDRIELEAERLDTLIGQILQLSHLRAVPTLPREPLDLTSLLNEIIDDARIEAGADEKRVDWSAPREVMMVDGDHGLLRSAIENVLRNAVRFTKPSSAVTVRADREGPDVSIVIDDRGPGVPEPDLQRIFEPFYRVAEARDRDSGGTGLGLAITARIVSLYGGNVRARNTGDGLRVEIALPAR
ncbi:MAG TPA: ATP-binding protein [Steroidobacteraceae bacterium]|nr:ATP-binding protein [Steroidobacteraceae bacterium]